jgi:hypothetical protein
MRLSKVKAGVLAIAGPGPRGAIAPLGAGAQLWRTVKITDPPPPSVHPDRRR